MSTFLILSGVIASTAIIILGIISMVKPAKIHLSAGIALGLVVLIFSSWFKAKKVRYGEAAPFAIPIGIAVGLGMYLTEMFF